MKFSETHEWIKIEEGIGIVGISRHAQNELKEIVSIQLPLIGKKLEIGEEAAILESTKAAVDLYAPVSGEVIAINEEALKNPSIVNDFPEGKGWLFEIKLHDPSELESLLDPEEYLEIVSDFA
jgi:glycine cleavage system H protein